MFSGNVDIVLSFPEQFRRMLQPYFPNECSGRLVEGRPDPTV